MPTLQVLANVKLNLLRPNTNVVVYAKQYDKSSRIIEADLAAGNASWDPPTSDIETVVTYLKPDGTRGVYDVIEDGSTPAVTRVSSGKIRIILAEQALTVAGNVALQVSFYTESQRLSTLSFIVSVEAATPDDTSLESSDYFSILSALIQGLLGATTHPPQIDPVSKNWMLWDENTSQYVDSGYSSVGVTGPSPHITSTAVTYVNSDSGTTVPSSGWSSTRPATVPGTWQWTKTVTTYDNGDSTTEYSTAYQGSDGEGAPGSQTPLGLDSTGAVGTSIAYSREDHKHPFPITVINGALKFPTY